MKNLQTLQTPKPLYKKNTRQKWPSESWRPSITAKAPAIISDTNPTRLMKIHHPSWPLFKKVGSPLGFLSESTKLTGKWKRKIPTKWEPTWIHRFTVCRIFVASKVPPLQEGVNYKVITMYIISADMVWSASIWTKQHKLSNILQ